MPATARASARRCRSASACRRRSRRGERPCRSCCACCRRSRRPPPMRPLTAPVERIKDFAFAAAGDAGNGPKPRNVVEGLVERHLLALNQLEADRARQQERQARINAPRRRFECLCFGKCNRRHFSLVYSKRDFIVELGTASHGRRRSKLTFFVVAIRLIAADAMRRLALERG